MPTQEKHMQKFIKYLVWTVVATLLSPFMIIGFLGATIVGSIVIGFEATSVVFNKLAEWVHSDD
jgi:hypothetical protein